MSLNPISSTVLTKTILGEKNLTTYSESLLEPLKLPQEPTVRD